MTRVRVATHVHSDWSYDGRWSLMDIAAEFSRRGYDAVLLAEHDRGFDVTRWDAYRIACAGASTAACVLVPGMEYSDPRNIVHIPVWGDIPFLGEGIETEELLRRVSEVGGLAVLAHPSRRDAWECFDPAWMDHLLGIELWNRKYDGYAPNSRAAATLGERPDLLPVVSLDFHTARQFHPLTMSLNFDGVVTEAQIYDAMRERRACATAFGIPAVHLTRGAVSPAMYCLERARRGVAAGVRRSGHLRAGAARR